MLSGQGSVGAPEWRVSSISVEGGGGGGGWRGRLGTGEGGWLQARPTRRARLGWVTLPRVTAAHFLGGYGRLQQTGAVAVGCSGFQWVTAGDSGAPGRLEGGYGGLQQYFLLVGDSSSQMLRQMGTVGCSGVFVGCSKSQRT